MNENEDELKRLKKELSHTRLNLVYLATQRSPKPFEAHGLLIRSAAKLQTREDWWCWERDALHGVLEIAEVDATGHARCPLCGDGVRDDWGSGKERGFSYPTGLEMHLEGKGRASQCLVMRTALERAHDDNTERFNETEITTKKTAATLALTVVKQICEQAGCRCKIYEGKSVVFLTQGRGGHHSLILSVGKDRYQICADNPRGLSFVEMDMCTAEEAAHALIWENRNRGKRWMKGR